jgi:AcrR family transcriptional regulator
MAQSESRRQSIVEAMARIAGRKGYREVAVADAIAEAGVSRTTFYKHFDGKLDCFLAAYDLAVERMLATIAAGCEPQRPWPERVRAGLESLIELLTAEPELARAAIVETAVAGAGARRRQWAAIARVALLLEAGEREGPELPANTGLMAVSAVTGLLFDEIQAGRTGELPRRFPELLFALFVPYLGPGRAAEEMRRADPMPPRSR